MPVIFNRPGIIITLIGCVAALAAMRLGPEDLSGLVFVALGASWVVADVFYRLKWGGRRFLHHLHGGHLYFVPMWVLGLALLAFGGQQFAGSLRLRRPSPPADVRPARPATTARTAATTPVVPE